MGKFGKVYLTLGTESLDNEKTSPLLVANVKITDKLLSNREDVIILETDDIRIRKEVYENWISKANELLKE